MIAVLVPIEEGRDASSAIAHVISLSRQEAVRVYLLNVRTPLPSYVARFIPSAERRAFHHDNGMRAMREAIARLDEAGIAHREEVRVGNKAETIVEFRAREALRGDRGRPKRGRPARRTWPGLDPRPAAPPPAAGRLAAHPRSGLARLRRHTPKLSPQPQVCCAFGLSKRMRRESPSCTTSIAAPCT